MLPTVRPWTNIRVWQPYAVARTGVTILYVFGMGKLVYGGTTEIGFEDRVLAHLQIVIGLKLRRKEGFFFSWRDEQGVGDGRSAIWIDPAIPLLFRYSGGRYPRINKTWLEQLTASSNSSQGLQLTEEIGALGADEVDADSPPGR
ncbi:ATP-dependent DNA ligase [Leifsonia sp. NPDC014704]|uniref:DUF7882 family protein n=2 Tax=unclassified Leifsonia TaxID=2663824 RepID=UPI0036F4A03C